MADTEFIHEPLKKAKKPKSSQNQKEVAPLKLNFECLKGEAVFNRPLDFILNADKVTQLQEEIEKTTLQVAELKDDRLLVLICDLLVENAVETYLSQIMLGYNKELADNKNFTFSLKISVAKALRFSSPKPFRGADIIRRIRNEFVHNLEIKDFSQLKPRLIDEVNKTLKDYCLERPLSEKSQKNFLDLTLLTVLGIAVFSLHVTLLNVYVRSDKLEEKLKEFSK